MVDILFLNLGTCTYCNTNWQHFIKIFITQIAEVFVGSSKECLSLKANPDLSVNSVVKEFGKLMKIFVNLSEDVCVVVVERPNAFDILKKAQLKLSRKKVPHAYRKETKRISYIMKSFITLKGKNFIGILNLSGTNFVMSLCEVLWYIDGHHSTISSCGYQIPAYFKDFQGFNAPELSKYCKRSAGNISTNVIKSLSANCLNYFSRENWESMSCELLANTMLVKFKAKTKS